MNEIVIQFASGLIVLLMGLIGYFLNRLVKSIDKLEETVDKLKIYFAEDRFRIQEIEKKLEKYN